ncbi:LOW QUALITY PROTEIN: pentatricopeptide repeat-containing protein At3g12770 [Cryptomeria japonica]|uniref:LOW QUALITY PROTEIN: pentatricopeptide repeat-containing protein At3g12770 n=1 Tax=Cryptomeria japonica TaxID=3369 RepID=UPI0027DA7B21|nr:LOW QUALITY PROTEIN: pentatricopeptide repeat-containing protein At3g12770 [Cryptomeria japonica]
MTLGLRNYTNFQKPKFCMLLFTSAISRDISLDTNAFESLFRECTDLESLRQIHRQAFAHGQNQNVFIATKLVGLYGMFREVRDARRVFEKMGYRNVFLWNEMIKGYACNGLFQEAISLYNQMQGVGIQGDRFTFPYVLKACAGLSALDVGKDIHDHVIRCRLQSNVNVGNALIFMYAKCHKMDVAFQVFDKMAQRNVVSWTTMISGYVQNGYPSKALEFFHQMKLAGIPPNRVTMLSVIPACAELGDLDEAKRLHDYVRNISLESDASVVTALVTMYAKCGDIKVARELFEKIPKRDVVSWSAMIGAFVQVGQANEAIILFNLMQKEGVSPNSVTFVNVLQACAHLGTLQQGTEIHEYIIRGGLEFDVFVGAALVDMYAKCGNITVARKLFDRLSQRNVVSWSAMIAGYGMHGLGEDALLLFTQMLQAGMKPNDITFISVLSACSHAGLVEQGWLYFDSMTRDYCIKPRVEHYTCMVDLLGRAGHLNEAQDFIQKMPLEPDDGVWGALLNACRIHRDVDLGQHVAEHLLSLEPTNAGYYLLLSNIYAENGNWDKVKQLRGRMEDNGVKKTPGCSLIEVNNTLHTFLVGDEFHPESKKIYAMLETLTGKMKDAGYVPNASCLLSEVEREAEQLPL